MVGDACGVVIVGGCVLWLLWLAVIVGGNMWGGCNMGRVIWVG